ncbi:MAG: hypothetical protein ABIU54_02020 [Candidatus Eisenbacteria bacterium]
MNAPGVLRARLTMIRAEFFTRRDGSWQARKGLLAVALALGLTGLLTYALTRGFATLADSGISVTEAGRVLATAFGATALGTLLLDLHATMATLLLAPDLQLLRRAPIRTRTVLGLKLLDALPVSSTMLVALALPATIAFALAYSNTVHAALVPLVLAALWGMPLGFGVAVASALVRLAPAARVREVIGLLTTLTVALLWLANTFLLPRLADDEPAFQDSLRAAIAHLPSPHATSPAAWAVDALIAPWPRALASLALLLVAAAGSLALAAGLGARALRATGAPIGASLAGPKRSSIPFTASLAAAFLRRDLALYLRDWTVMSDILVGALLWTLLPLAFVPLVAMEPRLLALTMLIALNVGLGHEVAARALPFERDALAWARLAPIKAKRWVLARLPGVLVIVLPLHLSAWVAITVTLHLPPNIAAEVLLWATAALATATAVGLWTGAAFGDPAWAHPRAMLHWNGRLVAVALLLIQAAAWLALWPLLDGFPVGWGACGAIVVAGISCSLAVHGASRLLARRWSPPR